MRQWIVDGALERVSVVIYDESGTRVEAHTIKNGGGPMAEPDPAVWRGFFRDSLASLPGVCAALKPLPDAGAFTCTFQIECVTAASAVDESRWLTLFGTNASTLVSSFFVLCFPILLTECAWGRAILLPFARWALRHARPQRRLSRLSQLHSSKDTHVLARTTRTHFACCRMFRLPAR